MYTLLVTNDIGENLGNVERMGSERLIKKVYESEVKGQRGRGRPRARWKDGVERYMSEGGLGGRRDAS